MLTNPQSGASKANKSQFLLLAGGRSTATRLRSARPLGAGSAEHGCCKRGLPRALQLRPHLAQPPLEQIFICACEGGAPRAPERPLGLVARAAVFVCGVCAAKAQAGQARPSPLPT